MADRRRQSPQETRTWLRQRPSLAELQAAFPDEWAAIQSDLAGIARRGDLDELKAYVLAVAEPPGPKGAQRRGRTGRDAPLAEDVRRAIAAAALRQQCLSAATGVTEGRVRFNLANGYVAQKLLFAQDLERKPVSFGWFRLLWPLVWQKRYLMPLVGPKGIYCFYSRPLVKRLAALIGPRSCLEIAAGDGTLSRFLRQAGADVIATDDHSWSHTVRFPDDVLRQDARVALRDHRPQVVLCSWPPAGNDFESAVFAADTVELYVVISSRHRFASGDWAAYERQTGFSFAEAPELSRLVLPPELEAAVYLFERT